MRIGVYGGSFNPPHVGHAMVSSWLAWTDRVDEVWWLPVAGHPFAKGLLPFEQRVALCLEVTALLPRTRVCDAERDLPTPNYTIDTLRHLSARHPGHRFQLVVGADVLGQVDQWKDWDGIQQEFRPIVVGRQGYPGPPDTIEFPDVSSTRVRALAAAGEPIGHLVPAVIRERVAELFRA